MLRLNVLFDRPDAGALAHGNVTYQAAQFLRLSEFADVSWWGDGPADADVCWDERPLLGDERIRARVSERLFVFVCHDYWCHPLRIVEELRRRPRALMVLRHESARRLFDALAPEIPKVVRRPGVETAIFHPYDGVKRVDVLLSGSETPDYPVRQRLNRLVRERAPRYGWDVLDLTGIGLMSNPPGTQHEYAPALASAKVSPTGTNRGGGRGAMVVTQYLDLSPARAQFDDPFYGLGTPEVTVQRLDTAGVTPRYLESLAARTLLVGDLPEGETEDWYRDKMVVVSPEQSDDEVCDELDRWIRDEAAREELVERAYRAVLAGETSQHAAAELARTIEAYL